MLVPPRKARQQSSACYDTQQVCVYVQRTILVLD